MEGPIDNTVDVVGQLLYDAILLDTSQHMAAMAKAGGPDAPSPADVPAHTPKFKKATKKLLKRLRRLNTSDTYRGLPVRGDSAQLQSLEFLRLFGQLAGLVHARLRGVPGLQVAPSGGPAVRGVTCLFLASGRTPFEGAWEAPGATVCMVLDSENPEELVAIGNVFCSSALGARAQITATLDRIAQGGADLEAMFQDLPGGGGEAGKPPADVDAVRSALTDRVVALIKEYDGAAFGEDSAQQAAPPAGAGGDAARDDADGDDHVEL